MGLLPRRYRTRCEREPLRAANEVLNSEPLEYLVGFLRVEEGDVRSGEYEGEVGAVPVRADREVLSSGSLISARKIGCMARKIEMGSKKRKLQVL